MQPDNPKPSDEKMTIEELATASQLTVRNIRAYQSRGILPSPRIRGRKGFYGTDHLKRLNQVAALQKRGYSLAAIQDLLAKIDPEDLDLGMVAVLSAWRDWKPVTFSRQQFRERFPFFAEDRNLLKRMEVTGHLEMRGEQVVVAWPTLLDVATTLHEMGATLDPFIALMERTQTALQEIARDVLQTFVEDILQKHEDADDPEVVASIVTDLRPQALAAVRSLFSHAMESNITALLHRTESSG
jgi:DNA-binding transcriptional MerR regulator